MQILQTQVNFICPVCNKEASSNVEVPEPNWAAGDKMSDLTSEDQTEVTCNLCSEVFSAYVQNSASDCTVSLDDYPETKVTADIAFFSPPPEEDEWINYSLPSNPQGVFMASYHELGDILAEYGKEGRGVLPHSGVLINRMVFSQQISALEAFLSDTLIKAAKENKIVLTRLLNGEQELKGRSLTLSAIARDVNIVEKTVIEHLQSILYHNLPKIEALYRIAFLIDIWPDNDTKVALLRAVVRRHDCVHRNGKTKDGEVLLFSTMDVEEALDTMVKFVEHISDEIAKGV